MAETTARARMRAWFREQIEGKESVVIPKVVTEAIRYIREDSELHDQLADEFFRPALTDLFGDELTQTRRFREYGDGGSAITEDERQERVERFSNRFLTWYERSGDRHVNVMEMTREDLQLAASERRSRGKHEYDLAALWERLADGLEGGQKVAERFTAEEIDGLYRNIRDAQEGVA